MATIEIKNLGPVKYAKFDLNKVNVIMGPQSSGKSTIAKVISYCTWVEKRRILDGIFRGNFLEQFKNFHNLGDAYFQPETYFKYSSDYCEIEFSNDRESEEDISIKNASNYKNQKLIYVPAERNFVASIPNLGRYNEKNNNILDFLYYWYEAKKSYPSHSVLSIPELNVKFYSIEEEDKDVVTFDDNVELSLQNSSSGVQSMLPLYLLVDYLTRVLYDRDVVLSPIQQEKIRKQVKPLAESQLERLKEQVEKVSSGNYDNPRLQEIKDELTTEKWEERLQQIINDIFGELSYTHSEFVIEEPEQNLFPTTQRDLIYYLMRVLNDSGRDHRLTFTTHSPYILYALNNCMMGSLVYDKMSEQDKGRLKCGKALIDPQKVSIYQIEDGILRPIQEEDGLIGANYFDDKMKELMDDFYVMLNYYGE